MKKNVYIVEIQHDWAEDYDIDTVFADKDRALDYAASYIVNHWSPEDEEVWESDMEESGKYISKIDYAKDVAENGEWFVRVSEYDLN